MHLVARQATREDRSAMLMLCLPESVRSDLHAIQEASAVWNDLWDTLSPEGIVLENISQGGERSSVGLLIGTYVTDEVRDEYAIHALTPNLLQRVVASAKEGIVKPIDQQTIGLLNASEGLNLLVCYFGWSPGDYMQSPAPSLRATIVNAYADQMGGNHLKSMFGEIGGATLLDLAHRSGCKVLNDYSDWVRRNGMQNAPKRPYVVGITREDALVSENYWMSRMFTYFPPKFFFTDSQRSILKLAREGMTDSEIAATLNTTIDAVKKRWTGIYDRVSKANPDLLPESGLNGRGSEKRRALLAHLRHRCEELQPYCRQKR